MTEREMIANKLKYHVFPTNRISDSSLDFYNDVYAFWNASWSKTLGELDKLEKLHADEFLRQGEATVITLDKEIIGFFSFSWFDLRYEASLDHSYFRPYPRDCLDTLKARGLNKLMTMGWLTVSPPWRKSELGPLVCEALIWQGYKRFSQSESDVLVAYTRNDRKINKAAYLYGSRCLREKLTSHNVEVDLIWTLKEDVRNNPDPLIHKTAQRLWDTRSIHDGANLNTERLAA